MTDYCDKNNPLSRDGTSQTQRLLKALDPSYVSVDERTIDDLLVFARKYAEYVKYYDSDDDSSTTESWKDFFENNIAVLIAVISNHDLDTLREDYEELSEKAELSPTNSQLEALFQFILEISLLIDKWYLQAVEGLALKKDIEIIIQSSLSETMKKIVAYDKGASVLTGWNAPELSYDGLSAIWGLDQTAINGISADSTIYSGATKKEKILSALDYINGLFEVHYGAISKIIEATPDYMKEAMSSYPYHEAHISLFLAFLSLFKYARQDLNRMTARHLDFYYRDLLQIKERDEEPDSVHIIFELAKQTSSHLVSAGTGLKAGKDASGVEVIYKTDNELAANKASVKKFKNIFIDRGDGYRIYSAPVANSGDGIGGDFKSDEEKWKTLGESQYDSETSVYREEEELTMEFGTAGYAIASPALFLSEGTRKVKLTLKTDKALSAADIADDAFKIYFSGKKGWIEGALADTDGIDFEGTDIILQIELAISDEPVVAYDKDKLGNTFDTDYPVLKMIFNNKEGTTYGYEKLRDIQVSEIVLNVEADEVSTVVLQSDNGLLDASKPFFPFGTKPTPESGFYIGSGEIFQKKLTYLRLSLDWKDVPQADLGAYYTLIKSGLTTAGFTVQGKMLYNRNWTGLGAAKSLFQNDATVTNTITYESELAGLQDYSADVISEELTEYKSTTARGVIKLELAAPSIGFGHKEFRDVYTKAVIKYAKSGDVADRDLIPPEPYTPQINTLKLKYKAEERIDLETKDNFKDRKSKFYHISPFGDKEVHRKLDSFCYLVPQYRYRIDEETTEENEGELYIGLTDLKPPQNLSVLFQMAEGSADPELERQTIKWSYLSGNNWVSFDDDEILSDSTDDLTTSGIISFDIPKAASSTNTLLDSGYHWLRASLPVKTGAVCATIAVVAQAVQASFENNSNDPAFLEVGIAAGTISKLQVKEAEIKAVSQPYAPFGGRVEERSNEYYRRVSERLRHKRRAINIWDNERLILEQFPSIYKVKCINHTDKCSEMAPGSVMIVPISNVRNKNAVNPLQPATSVNTLDEIKKYISKVMSTFVDLRVLNPRYEEVFVKFKVEFYQGKDKGLYSQKLNEDIKKFLSPWAYEEGADISFGGTIHGSYIINFIEERDYVDYITDFELYHVVDGVKSAESQEKAEATAARSILVSAGEHEIKPVSKDNG